MGGGRAGPVMNSRGRTSTGGGMTCGTCTTAIGRSGGGGATGTTGSRGFSGGGVATATCGGVAGTTTGSSFGGSVFGSGVAATTSGAGVLSGILAAGAGGWNSFHATTPTATSAQPAAMSVPIGAPCFGGAPCSVRAWSGLGGGGGGTVAVTWSAGLCGRGVSRIVSTAVFISPELA